MADLSSLWPTTTDDDGSGQFGTNTKKSYFDGIQAAIEDNIHSTTNPTIKNKTIIDELKTSRGNKSSLDERIHDVINPDGELILPASIATKTRLKEIIGTQNLVKDGLFWNWARGNTGVIALGHWNGYSGNVTFTMCGLTCPDTTQWIGQFTCKATATDSNGAYLVQGIIDAVSWPFFGDSFIGEYFSAGIWCKTSTANCGAIQISDGASSTSTYHTGGGDWEWLQVTHKVSSSANSLALRLRCDQATSAYYSGACMIWGQTPPEYYHPEEWVRGTLCVPMAGVPETGEKFTYMPEKPIIVMSIKANAVTAPAGGPFQVGMQKWLTAAWQDIWSVTNITVLGDGQQNNGSLPDSTYDKRCLLGRSGADYNFGVLKFTVTTVNAAANLNVWIYFIQAKNPLDMFLQYDKY